MKTVIFPLSNGNCPYIKLSFRDGRGLLSFTTPLKIQIANNVFQLCMRQSLNLKKRCVCVFVYLLQLAYILCFLETVLLMCWELLLSKLIVDLWWDTLLRNPRLVLCHYHSSCLRKTKYGWGPILFAFILAPLNWFETRRLFFWKAVLNQKNLKWEGSLFPNFFHKTWWKQHSRFKQHLNCLNVTVSWLNHIYFSAWLFKLSYWLSELHSWDFSISYP